MQRRLVMPASGSSAALLSPVARKQLHLSSGGGTLESLMALLGWMHSTTVIFLGSFLLMSLAPSWRHWSWPPQQLQSLLGNTSTATLPLVTASPLHTAAASVSMTGLASTGAAAAARNWWLVGDTSAGQSALFICSAAYFALDCLQLQLRGRLTSSKGQRVLLHHLLSIAGLLACVLTGRDGPLVLVGLVLAEASSPPWHAVRLCRSASRSSWRARLVRDSSSGGGGDLAWLRCLLRPLLSAALSMDLTLLHVMSFLLTRLMLLQLVAHAVMPFAALLSTKLVATALLMLSAGQFLDLLPMLHGDTHEGTLWRQLQAELRAMQRDCCRDDDDCSSADSSSNDARRGFRSGSGSSGASSPYGSRKGSRSEEDSSTAAAAIAAGQAQGKRRGASSTSSSRAPNSPQRNAQSAAAAVSTASTAAVAATAPAVVTPGPLDALLAPAAAARRLLFRA